VPTGRAVVVIVAAQEVGEDWGDTTKLAPPNCNVPLENTTFEVVQLPPTAATVSVRDTGAPYVSPIAGEAVNVPDVVAGAITVSCADAEEATPATDPVIVVDPGTSAVTTLFNTEATSGFEEVYTGNVHAAVVLFDRVAVQLKSNTAPSDTDAVPGAIAIAVTVAAGDVTVTCADAEDATPTTVARIVADPGFSPVTTLLETEATLGFEVV
jgi:hypothetical protein